MTAAIQGALPSLDTPSSSSAPPRPVDPSNTLDDASQEAPPSPVRPPVSPITPATTFAQLATPLPPEGLPPLDSAPSTQPPPPPSQPVPKQKQRPSSKSQTKSQPTKSQAAPPPNKPKPTFIPAPNPIPFEEADNTDAAALRAAIAVLQIQKQKSQQDIKTLQQLRQGLLQDPDAFTQELLAGRLKEDKSPNDPLHPTFASTGQTDEEVDNKPSDAGQSDAHPSTSDQPTSESAAAAPIRYPPIPSAQNVIRCPPINWAKYHIAGEPLERMHEEQRKRPTAGEPVRDPTLQQQQLQQQQQQQQPTAQTPPSAEHHVFAPYEPFRDKPASTAEQLGLGTQPRRVPKKADAGGAKISF